LTTIRNNNLLSHNHNWKNFVVLITRGKPETNKMVCAKCSKLSKTTLATPVVKKKSEMYYGSSASSSAASSSTTLGQTGISKASTPPPTPTSPQMLTPILE
jgi:hypothetical protein